ncbi:MAG: thiamine phosphate synthase [Pyrinomonadaceae bacterium]
MSKRPFSLPRVYAITDVSVARLSHLEQVRQFVEGGASLIQLRDKSLSAGEFYQVARVAISVAGARNVRLIINDRVDIALAVGADGVHLGQHDMPPAAARQLLGSEAIIGLSTHDLEQARAAVELPIDYLALGPIFRTCTKADPGPEVGLAGLQAVRSQIGEFPLVAIGGISLANAQNVIKAGADSVAVVSALLSPPGNILEQTKSLLRATNSAR